MTPATRAKAAKNSFFIFVSICVVNYGTIATEYSGAVGLEINVLHVAYTQRYIKSYPPQKKSYPHASGLTWG